MQSPGIALLNLPRRNRSESLNLCTLCKTIIHLDAYRVFESPDGAPNQCMSGVVPSSSGWRHRMFLSCSLKGEVSPFLSHFPLHSCTQLSQEKRFVLILLMCIATGTAVHVQIYIYIVPNKLDNRMCVP